MREIEFRGKRKIDGKWVYGCLTKQETFAHEPNSYQNRFSIAGYEVEPDSVGQYTGTHAKNGRKIYEGDIVSGFEYADFFTGIDKEVNAVVRWIEDYAAFMFDADVKYFHDMRDSNIVTVIGNIHENKELING